VGCAEGEEGRNETPEANGGCEAEEDCGTGLPETAARPGEGGKEGHSEVQRKEGRSQAEGEEGAPKAKNIPAIAPKVTVETPTPPVQVAVVAAPATE